MRTWIPLVLAILALALAAFNFGRQEGYEAGYQAGVKEGFTVAQVNWLRYHRSGRDANGDSVSWSGQDTTAWFDLTRTP